MANHHHPEYASEPSEDRFFDCESSLDSFLNRTQQQPNNLLDGQETNHHPQDDDPLFVQSHNNNNNEQQHKSIVKPVLYTAWQYIRHLPKTWPRLWSLTCGVVLPMLGLVSISLALGYLLAEYESPREIEQNNAILQERAQVSRASLFLGNVSASLPQLCLSVIVRNETADWDDAHIQQEIQRDLYDLYVTEKRQRLFNTISNDNVRGIAMDEIPELFPFMRRCGEIVWNTTEVFTDSRHLQPMDGARLSFHWNRCLVEQPNNGTKSNSQFSKLFGSYVRSPLDNLTQLRPDVQEALVVNEWTRQQQLLQNEYTLELVPVNSTALDQFLANSSVWIQKIVGAYKRSTEDANGLVNCEANSDSGAWFWFTIMTTIGYGNTAPQTFEGRTMVFTAGFFSILVFAVVLTNAGKIVTSITDDCLSRVSILRRQVKQQWLLCLIWGSLYYGWMLLLAWYTVLWKKERLNEEFEWDDAYWFAFITTTTVGLGDYYLEHQVLLRRDLVSFTLVILVGFVFLANFLVKLTDLLTALFHWSGGTDLDTRLKDTSLWRLAKRKQTPTCNDTHKLCPR